MTINKISISACNKNIQFLRIHFTIYCLKRRAAPFFNFIKMQSFGTIINEVHFLAISHKYIVLSFKTEKICPTSIYLLPSKIDSAEWLFTSGRLFRTRNILIRESAQVSTVELLRFLFLHLCLFSPFLFSRHWHDYLPGMVFFG